MFLSGAQQDFTARRLPVGRAVAVVLALLFTATITLAGAQTTPSIAVDSFRYDVGDTLHLSGVNLEPNATYTITLTPPEDSQEEPRTLDVTTDVRGGLRVDALLRAPGSFIVALSGPRIDARLTVQVTGPPAADGAPADAEPAGEQAAEQADEAVAAPDEAPQGEAAPNNAGANQERAEQAGGQEADDQVQQDQAQQDQAPSVVTPAPVLPELPLQPPGPSMATPTFSLSGDSVIARRDGEELWTFDFPALSGGTAGLLVLDDVVLVGNGNHVLTFDQLNGTVNGRARLPAKVVAIERVAGSQAGTSGVEVSVRYEDGETAQLAWPLEDDADFAFDPDLELYGWLRAEADVVDPAARLARDTSNPFLYLAAAADQPQRLTALRRNALLRAETFYEFGQLANEFLREPNRDTEMATQAMDSALADFVTRGYQGSLLFDEESSAAYGFPASSMREALAADDDVAADFWAPWLYRLSGNEVPAHSELLAAYADDLRARGDTQAAATWDQRAATGGSFEVRTTLERAARALGSSGWYGVLSLLIAILALHLTLAAKYWRAQTAHLGLRTAQGRTSGRAARLFTLRYATITEKLVVLLLFASVLALAALAGWTRNSAELPAGLGRGTLAGPSNVKLIDESLPDSPERSFILGFAAQSAGDNERAAAIYRDLSDNADAMNNLGVLRGDNELLRLAIELQPRHPEATYNLGLDEESPSLLQAAYRPEQPLLAAPDSSDLMRASAGDYLAALGAVFTNPWTSLTEQRALSPQWLWVALVVLFLAWVAWTIITLLIPRPAAARNAPRNFLYHLLALLLPGSGLADELWGVLLLVPWAIFGIDTLIQFFAFSAEPTFALRTDLVVLIVIYVVNTVAFIVEYLSYRKRMRQSRLQEAVVQADYGLNDSGI